MIEGIIQSILDAESEADRIKHAGEVRMRKIGTDAQLKIEQMREQSNHALTEEFKTAPPPESNTASLSESGIPKIQKQRIDMAVQFVLDCITEGAK